MIQIFATNKNGKRFEIKDLYWFEEEGVHTFEGKGSYGQDFVFEIVVDGVRVYLSDYKMMLARNRS